MATDIAALTEKVARLQAEVDEAHTENSRIKRSSAISTRLLSELEGRLTIAENEAALMREAAACATRKLEGVLKGEDAGSVSPVAAEETRTDGMPPTPGRTPQGFGTELGAMIPELLDSELQATRAEADALRQSLLSLQEQYRELLDNTPVSAPVKGSDGEANSELVARLQRDLEASENVNSQLRRSWAQTKRVMTELAGRLTVAESEAALMREAAMGATKKAEIALESEAGSQSEASFDLVRKSSTATDPISVAEDRISRRNSVTGRSNTATSVLPALLEFELEASKAEAEHLRETVLSLHDQNRELLQAQPMEVSIPTGDAKETAQLAARLQVELDAANAENSQLRRSWACTKRVMTELEGRLNVAEHHAMAMEQAAAESKKKAEIALEDFQDEAEEEGFDISAPSAATAAAEVLKPGAPAASAEKLKEQLQSLLTENSQLRRSWATSTRILTEFEGRLTIAENEAALMREAANMSTMKALKSEAATPRDGGFPALPIVASNRKFPSRPAQGDDDLKDIAEILNHYIENTAVVFDIEKKTLEERRKWLADRSARMPVVVVDDPNSVTGRVIAWGSLNQWSTKKAYDITAEVSVYVHKDFRGSGLGSSVLEALLLEGRKHGYHTLVSRIAITDDTVASIAMHKKYGFKEAGLLKECGKKFDKLWDVQSYQLHI